MDKKEEFTEWFDKQGFKYFKAYEFTRYFERELNDYPPKSKWKNIVSALEIVDKLRGDLGHPIRITSSYRADKYNKKVGGASKSLHKEFKALDIQCSGLSPARLYHRLKKYRDAGEFKGGLSEYKTFVHIDVRGTNADW